MFNAMDIAVMFLAFIGGMCLAFVFSSKFARFVLSITVVIILISGLLRGYSLGLENITYNLTFYISQNPLGFISFLVGFIVGFIVRRKK
jgi:hypothetical protein